MCGIAGIISSDPAEVSVSRLQIMTDAIAHRGPQGDGFWINSSGNTGFGHRRLAIIDLSDAGVQPMHYAAHLTLVFNGEIYNYKELRSTLQKSGFRFDSETDSEVILAAYSAYGEDCLDYLDGMFAFAIWDERSQSFFAARDRFGEKPFYYHAIKDNFLFASEMKSLWAAGVRKSINHRMLLSYLSLGYVQNPADKSETFFEDLLSLPPGHCISIKNKGNPLVRKYYSPVDESVPASLDTAAEQLLQLLETSIKRRLRSDVPLGTSLSGGLDSTVIANMIHSQGVFKTFSAVFPGFQRDESALIKETVSRYKLKSFTVTPTAQEMLDDFELLCHHQEEPFPSSSIYTQYRVYKLAKEQGVTVILDGQGADEILGGYPRYIHWYLQELIRKGKFNLFQKEKTQLSASYDFAWSAKNWAAAFLPGLANKQLNKKTRAVVMQNDQLSLHYRNAWFESDRYEKPEINSLNDMLRYNSFRFGLEELLRFADRNSMAHGREVRLPFLYHKLVEFAIQLPSSMKFRDGFGKYLLRYAMHDKLSASVAWRPGKTGFEPPQKNWFSESAVQDAIQDSRKKLISEGILSKQVLQKKIQPHDAHAAGNYDFRYLVAGVIL